VEPRRPSQANESVTRPDFALRLQLGDAPNNIISIRTLDDVHASAAGRPALFKSGDTSLNH
jgi:hypothetical protein